MKLKETSVEWALKHLKRFYDSDFYPKSFEFEAFSHHWSAVKPHILSLELEDYVPKTPFTALAPKAGSTYRIVQQLDPIDCLIFTALVYELTDIIENYRIPASERIACSYRVKPDLNGSFFTRNDEGWSNFVLKSEALSAAHRKGYVIVCDITDFYNQISLHRINNIISEAGGGGYDAHASVLEEFLKNLNTNTSRGIPVGPAASIVWPKQSWAT